MGDLSTKPGMPMKAPPKYYPHLNVPAKEAGMASAKIGQRITATITGKVTSMHAGEGQPHEIGIEVRKITLNPARKLKEEKLRRVRG